MLQNKEWKCEVASLADVAGHLKFLNLQLQGCHRMITDMHDAVKVSVQFA